MTYYFLMTVVSSLKKFKSESKQIEQTEWQKGLKELTAARAVCLIKVLS